MNDSSPRVTRGLAENTVAKSRQRRGAARVCPPAISSGYAVVGAGEVGGRWEVGGPGGKDFSRYFTFSWEKNNLASGADREQERALLISTSSPSSSPSPPSPSPYPHSPIPPLCLSLFVCSFVRSVFNFLPPVPSCSAPPVPLPAVTAKPGPASARDTRLAGAHAAAAALAPPAALLVAALVEHALEGTGVVVLALARDGVQRVAKEHGLVATQTGYDPTAGVGSALAGGGGGGGWRVRVVMVVMVVVQMQVVGYRRRGRRREEDDGTRWI